MFVLFSSLKSQTGLTPQLLLAQTYCFTGMYRSCCYVMALRHNHYKEEQGKLILGNSSLSCDKSYALPSLRRKKLHAAHKERKKCQGSGKGDFNGFI